MEINRLIFHRRALLPANSAYPVCLLTEKQIPGTMLRE